MREVTISKSPARVGEEWSEEALKSLSMRELEALYRGLPTPSITEMHGEYRAGYIGCDHPIANVTWRLAAWNPIISGVWQAKSFEPLSDAEGRGLNVLKLYGRRLFKWPMRTTMSSSFIDGEEVFMLDYPFYRSGSAVIKMTDEIRRVTDGLYLGIGHWRPLVPMASLWFTLSGPVGPFESGHLAFKKRVAYRA